VTTDKLALLRLLKGATLRQPAQITQLHDALLFVRAFPDNPRVLEAAREGLATIATKVRRLPASARAKLGDSAIAGTSSRHTFEAPIARWLSEKFPRDADIDWSAVSNARGLEFLMALVVLRPEQDGLENSGLSAREWLRRAKGAAAGSDLAWLIRQLSRVRTLRSMGFALYDHLEIPVVWRLQDTSGASARNELKVNRFYFRNGLRRLPRHPQQLIAKALPRIELVDGKRARRILDVTRSALTARCREVYALAHANPDEVYLADLGEGVALAVYGVIPQQRLSLESNYGYLLLSNGVPIGYGGVTPLYRQANTGVNLFESFRGSEAAFLWAQTLRAFRTLFGVHRFVVNPFQFGADNTEAIASGAFWLYYRLGFRPVDAELSRVAAREWAKVRLARGYRTSAATLRRLAGDDLELVLPGARRSDRFPEPWLAALALRASEELAKAGRSDRHADASAVAARVARALGVRNRERWSRAEREAFVALAPVMALLNLNTLSVRSRGRVVALMRAKGHAQERGYARAAARDRVVLPALMAVARKSP